MLSAHASARKATLLKNLLAISKEYFRDMSLLDRKSRHLRLRIHAEGLENHFEKASSFLVKCQIVEPYVEKGVLRGSVCPWEVGGLNAYGFTILEDFHDTLEAIWAWSYYAKISGNLAYNRNIQMAWEYVTANFPRFIQASDVNGGLYDCAWLALTGSVYERIFSDRKYRKWVETAGNRLSSYVSRLHSIRGREYSDPWWMSACLASAAFSLRRTDWLEVAQDFVRRNIMRSKKPFSKVEKEPRHLGPGGHDFFSSNANKALALVACFPSEATAARLLVDRFLPSAPGRFVKRHADENAWNANVAAALGRSYLVTKEREFLRRYFVIMDELMKRDYRNSCALPRSATFPRRESWVTVFYAYAYSSPHAFDDG